MPYTLFDVMVMMLMAGLQWMNQRTLAEVPAVEGTGNPETHGIILEWYLPDVTCLELDDASIAIIFQMVSAQTVGLLPSQTR